MGLKSKQTPYEGWWIFLPMMVLPSVLITWLIYFVVSKWQPQYAGELNWATAKVFGCGSGMLFHFSCWLAGAFSDDFKAVKIRLKEFCDNIVVSFRLAFSCYWEDVKTLGLMYWIEVAIIGLNAGIFVDALLDFLALRGM